MHDPMTVAFDIKSPFKSKPSASWPKGYRSTIVTIWHKDPCRDGSDDSCGWFMRARHGDEAVREKIRKRIDYEWDAQHSGLFDAAGAPRFSVAATAIKLFHFAAFEYFGHNWRRTDRFMKRNHYDIVHFAENGTDSLHPAIVSKYGPVPRDERVREMSNCLYGWILRAERRWWQHPRWHFWHWRIQISSLQLLWRTMFVRCAKCGGRFKYNESASGSWDGDAIWHSRCDGVCAVSTDAEIEKIAKGES